MKPENIFLIRHGESEGNADKKVYEKKPDYSLLLTPTGIKQAENVGKAISEFINEPAMFYVSPMWRARQTCEHITRIVPVWKKYEDPRIREQEWGHKTGLAYQEGLEVERDNYGQFYYRFPHGESCADVFDRVSDFMNTLHRDFEKPDFPRNCVIVTHGMTLRVFLMRWFHLSVEEFELLANPRNCEYHRLTLCENGRYELVTELRKYEKPTHPFQYATTT